MKYTVIQIISNNHEKKEHIIKYETFWRSIYIVEPIYEIILSS